MRDIRIYWNYMYFYFFSVCGVGWGERGDGNRAISKREFSLKQKNNMWKGFSRPIEILVIFWRGSGGFQWKKMGKKQKEEVLKWNTGKRRLRVCENPVRFCPCDIGWEMVAYWSQNCKWLLLPLLSFQSHFMGCIAVCLEKVRGDSEVK